MDPPLVPLNNGWYYSRYYCRYKIALVPAFWWVGEMSHVLHLKIGSRYRSGGPMDQ